MKRFALFCFIVLAAVTFVRSESDDEDLREEYCISPPAGCYLQECNEDNTIRHVKGCSLDRCAGKQLMIGIKEVDPSKRFPECCARPICSAAPNVDDPRSTPLAEKKIY